MPASNIHIRPAEPSELPAITQLRMDAFGENASVQAFFPDPVRRAVDYPAWRMASMQDAFAEPGRHFIVAVERSEEDGMEQIAGAAEWIAPGGPDPRLSAEEAAAKSAERKGRLPASLDQDAVAAFSETVSHGIRTSLDKAGFAEGSEKDMWDLNSVAVSADHQRKGIGRMLVDWGIDRATEERKDVLIVANPGGAPLYRKMGLEEIGSMVRFPGRPDEESSWVFVMRCQAQE